MRERVMWNGITLIYVMPFVRALHSTKCINMRPSNSLYLFILDVQSEFVFAFALAFAYANESDNESVTK